MTWAVKVMRGEGASLRAHLEKELTVLERARHPHLLTLVGASLDDGAPCCLVSGGSLLRHLTERRPLPWRCRLVLLQQLGTALDYLHFLCMTAGRGPPRSQVRQCAAFSPSRRVPG
jgi:serine/threonine protein kinase